MADAMKLVSVEQMKEAGFSFGLYSTLGHPAGTWGYTSPFGFSAKGFAREEQAWDDARVVFLREQKISQGYFAASPPAREEAPAEGAGIIQHLSDALAAVKYVPGDHPVIPVKHDAFVKRVQSLVNAALRNRTSEPEAGAVAWQRKRPEGLGGYAAWVDCDTGDIPHYRRMGQEIRALYTRPAPATADKLRVAVEALERAQDRINVTRGPMGSFYRTESSPEAIYEAKIAIAAALAALNEGGE